MVLVMQQKTHMEAVFMMNGVDLTEDRPHDETFPFLICLFEPEKFLRSVQFDPDIEK